jgi:dephospho-CoA kinase
MERDSISEEAALKRFSSQHDEEFFRRNSDYIIENNGSADSAYSAAARLAQEIIRTVTADGG